MNPVIVLPFILVVVFFIFVVKIASVALNMTGLDERKAFFQALSAITGTGFTTRDSELIVNHEIRRRIIMVLMILGNAGLVSVITTLTFSFMKGSFAPVLINTSLTLIVTIFVVQFLRRRGFTRKFTKKIQERLMQSSGFTKRPVEEIMRLAEGYGIAEVTLNEDCSDIGKTLFDSSFRQRDILILAIERGAKVIPAPHATDDLKLNDTLICYGKLDNIAKITRTGV